MKLIHDGGFTREDKETYKQVIHSNTLKSIHDLLEAMERLDISFANPENQVYFDLIMPSTDMTPEIGKAIYQLWQDHGVKQAYNQRNEFQLYDSTL